MTIFKEEDGWYNEDTEGPYTEVLRTKGDWSVFRLTKPHRGHDDKYHAVNRVLGIEMDFNTLEEAKKGVPDDKV